MGLRLRHGLLFASLIVAGCEDKTPASDVRGNYTLTFDDKLTFILKVGGAEYRAEGGEDEVVTFDVGGRPVELDLSQFCGREEVKCPSETLWSAVSIDQPQINASRPNTHVINVVNNTEHELPPGVSAEVLAGLVDERDRFGILIDADSRSQGDCGLLAISTAGGRFSHEGETLEVVEAAPALVDAGVVDGGISDGGAVDSGNDAGIEGAPTTRLVWPAGAPVVGIEEGKVSLGFLGACAFNDTALLAATLEIKTGFAGTRTGAFDPPPFTPVDPEDLEEGIVLSDGGVGGADGGGWDDAGAESDAGADSDAGGLENDAGVVDSGT